MDERKIGKDLINSALDKQEDTVIGEENMKALPYSEFCTVVNPLIHKHEDNNDLKHGECHIAIDLLPKGTLPKDVSDISEGVSVAVCGSLSTIDKFHILDALMGALDMDTMERVAYFAANAEDLLNR